MVARRHHDPWTLTIEGAREVRDRIGHDLFAAFLKCYEGIERLYALEHLLHFNFEMTEKDSPARARNLRVVVLFLGSTMYEVGKALQELCSARVVEKMTNRDLWTPVNKLRKLWRGEKRLKVLRNDFGFHLGHQDDYRTGLEVRLKASDDLMFLKGRGIKRHDAENVLSFDVLLASSELTSADIEAITVMTQLGHINLPEHLHDVWVDVLETAGIEVVEEVLESA